MTPSTSTVVNIHPLAPPATARPPIERQATTSTTVQAAMRLHADDNLLVARRPLAVGTAVDGFAFVTQDDIPPGHKFAARTLHQGETIVEQGQAIGRAASTIEAGARLHAGNVVALEPRDADTVRNVGPALSLLPTDQRASFNGFLRDNGSVGTRNYIIIVCTVNCAATTSRRIADHFTAKRLAAYPNVDGVIPLVHEIGCGMEMSGEPMELLRRTIAGHVRSPNVGGALIVALGCERNHVHGLMEQEKLTTNDSLKTLVMQENGGTRKTIDAGIAAIEAILPVANRVQRQPLGAQHLKVGLQCDGAEGFTALAANPALGIAADLLVRNGATVVLSRTSEVFGAVDSLVARAATPKVGQQLVGRIDWWLAYSQGRDTSINARPTAAGSPGAIINRRESAVGQIAMAGTSMLNEVVEYARPISGPGLVFMDTPSDDAISVTGQIAGGVNLVCMTTGRGSTFGSLPAPTVKLSASTPLYLQLEDDMDLNCGPVIDGEATVQQMGQEIFERLLRHASGELTKSEEIGLGENEFVPWPIGVTS
jgi:altronate hydrolase